MMNGAPLQIAPLLAGRRILFVGATGFIGKVALSMLLRHYPGVGTIYAMVRPGAGETSEDRFFKSVAASRPFDPVREVWGGAFDAFLREKVKPIGGDVSKAMLQLGEEQIAELGTLDAIINCAGLVSFNPSLEQGLRINTLGVGNVLEVARRTRAAVIHVSTCFVAGNRDGEIWEDEPIARFPRESELPAQDFSVEAEIADCERLIAQTRERADDRAHTSLFREAAVARLRAEGRDPEDEKALRASVQRERKKWTAERLTELGMERSRHWGWPNTYTYTKALGEQLCAAARDVRTCIVRPSIVESAVHYPFSGWNEGFNTTSPLIFLALKGHRSYPAGERTVLDVIPVDLVASGLLAATAATIGGENEPVYQLCSGDRNPLLMQRTVELTGLFKRRHFQERTEGSALWNALQARLEPTPVSREAYNGKSAPRWKGLADAVRERLERLRPQWGAPRLQASIDRAEEKLGQISARMADADELFQIFMPFTFERDYVFRADHIRALHARLAPEDQAALPWSTETIDWRHYWMDVHIPGLQKWVFPSLEEEFQTKPRPLYTYRDLLEMFDTATKLHARRTAMRLHPPKECDEPARRFTYADLQDLAGRVSAGLSRLGVSRDDKVMLLSENRPEWGIAYFGILKAGAAAVPVDAGLSLEEVANLLRSSSAKVLILSERQRERLSAPGRSLEDALAEAGAPVRVARFEPLLAEEPALEAGPRTPRANELASLIFTSGTTGRAKGVMLSHRNFTSLLSRLGGVFDVDRHDAFVSVLPLHHTFEFTAGLLMPLMRGAEIHYLDEVSPENLSRALRDGQVTALVGVPALWQLLHRRIQHELSERGRLALSLFEWVVERNRALRERMPGDLHLGKLLFWPIHRRFGGRIRLMVSGGSALAAETLNAFQGLGFRIFEGYGLTEAAPVLTVNRPGSKIVAGAVGEALPGIEVRLHEPDAQGVGEVVAAGPNVMMGYYGDPDRTAEVLRDGWLHTGDLGRFDADRRLFIVGRKKDVILGPSGENVYPDEIEELYGSSPYVKELSVVGLPREGGGELVACLLVPDYEKDGLSRAELHARVHEHVKSVSAKLPVYKRIQVLHLWSGELPRTATRKVKRPLIVEELQRLTKLTERASETTRGGSSWLHHLLADLCGAPRERVQPSATLSELGFDSLMYAELGASLESAGVDLPEDVELSAVGTVADLERLVSRFQKATGKRPRASAPQPEKANDLPGPIVALGRWALHEAHRLSYENLLDVTVTGRAYIPTAKNFIVAANHASHLDMGLVKHALGDWGKMLVPLAAKDYFFEGALKKAYFENFTNLVPIDRHGMLRESLRLASEVLARGCVLLLFPEGTRSRTGVMAEFKSSIGYLALQNGADVLPMFLEGTHEALPVSSVLPRKRRIAAHIGPLLTIEWLRESTRGLRQSEAHRVAAGKIEEAVRRLDPSGAAQRRGSTG
jgi:long-chain acyl-CoA synthetase